VRSRALLPCVPQSPSAVLGGSHPTCPSLGNQPMCRMHLGWSSGSQGSSSAHHNTLVLCVSCPPAAALQKVVMDTLIIGASPPALSKALALMATRTGGVWPVVQASTGQGGAAFSVLSARVHAQKVHEVVLFLGHVAQEKSVLARTRCSLGAWLLQMGMRCAGCPTQALCRHAMVRTSCGHKLYKRWGFGVPRSVASMPCLCLKSEASVAGLTCFLAARCAARNSQLKLTGYIVSAPSCSRELVAAYLAALNQKLPGEPGCATCAALP
jgi:hypothetical protein